MIEAGEIAIGFVAGRSLADLRTDRQLLFAVLRAVEIVGEAASKIGSQTRTRHPNIPWRNIVGMRNRIVHAYLDVDPDVLWRTITDDIPSLLAGLRALITDQDT